jgi:aldehyde dehydrogenase (NAD+)
VASTIGPGPGAHHGSPGHLERPSRPATGARERDRVAEVDEDDQREHDCADDPLGVVRHGAALGDGGDDRAAGGWETDDMTTAIDDIPASVERVRDGFAAGLLANLSARRTQLRQLRRLVTEQDRRIAEALRADLGKPAIEAYATEAGFLLNEIDHTLKHMSRWVAPHKVKLGLSMRPGSAKIVQEPLGTVLIIAPWNYPFHLLLAPLIPALAAGNSAVLKPSELAPATAELVTELVPKYLDERLVAIVNGGVPETTALLEERFDHVFYTGNGTVGRVVMTAAARHLTPVTLELGGKSPVIVAADADVDVAARRIAWGKFLNAGQTCVAPDYVLVDRSVEDRLLGGLLRAVHDFYGDDPEASPDYCRIISERHWDRLRTLLDAGGYEATVTGGHGNRATRFMAPTVLAGVKPDAAVMADEIFGPVLPVLAVDSLDEAIHFVNDRPKPLALYVFSRSDGTTDRVVEHTSSGGVSLNHVLLHLGVPDLPFGGVGASGMGAYHGKHGFDIFSHAKPVLSKPTRPDPSVMYPPYKGWKQKVLRKLL